MESTRHNSSLLQTLKFTRAVGIWAPCPRALWSTIFSEWGGLFMFLTQIFPVDIRTSTGNPFVTGLFLWTLKSPTVQNLPPVSAHYAENIVFFSPGDSNLIIKLLHLSFTKLLYLSLSYAPFGYKQHLFPLFTTASHQTLTEVEYPPPNTPQIHFSVHTVFPSSGCLYTFTNLSLLCS